MTTHTPTPPCLGEREAVARTLREAFESWIAGYGFPTHRPRSGYENTHTAMCWNAWQASHKAIAKHIEPLRTENETLRAERDAAIAGAEEAERKAAEAKTALVSVRSIITDAAMTGFNHADGDWPERLFQSQAKTTAAIRALTTPEHPHGD